MTSPALRIACVGECMIELTLPREGGAGGIGFAGDSFNVAVYLKRRAGASVDVTYVTALGTDPLSNRMLEFFRNEDLSTDLVERRLDRVPGLYAISLDDKGERSFTYWRDSSAARTLFQRPAEVTPDRLANCALIYLSGISVAILSPEARADLREFLVRYRAAGGLVSFDSNYRPRLWPDRDTARREIASFWSLTDIALPSIDDEMALFGDGDAESALARLADFGVRRGALKQGAEGPRSIGGTTALPAFPPAARVVDTTAAGDSFNGAYLAALLSGAPDADCLMAGHRMASQVIGFPGAIIPRDA